MADKGIVGLSILLGGNDDLVSSCTTTTTNDLGSNRAKCSLAHSSGSKLAYSRSYSLSMMKMCYLYGLVGRCLILSSVIQKIILPACVRYIDLTSQLLGV